LIGVKFERIGDGRGVKILHSPVDEYFEGIDTLELPERTANYRSCYQDKNKQTQKDRLFSASWIAGEKGLDFLAK
jgi:hypothetical protein